MIIKLRKESNLKALFPLKAYMSLIMVYSLTNKKKKKMLKMEKNKKKKKMNKIMLPLS